MGIGGLDKEFSAIFNQAFASRVFPPEADEQLGVYNIYIYIYIYVYI
jgi:vesicle-fusing ATPase